MPDGLLRGTSFTPSAPFGEVADTDTRGARRITDCRDTPRCRLLADCDTLPPGRSPARGSSRVLTKGTRHEGGLVRITLMAQGAGSTTGQAPRFLSPQGT